MVTTGALLFAKKPTTTFQTLIVYMTEAYPTILERMQIISWNAKRNMKKGESELSRKNSATLH